MPRVANPGPSTPSAIRQEVARLHSDAQAAMIRGEASAADALIDQANGLIDRHEQLTGVAIDLSGTVLPMTFKGNLEPSVTELLVGAGVDPSDMNLAEQAAAVAEMDAAALAAHAAQRDALIRDHVRDVLGVDVSKLSQAELGELVDANLDRFEQAALADVGIPPPERVAVADGDQFVHDFGAGVREFLNTPLATTIPAHLADKVAALGDAVTGPAIGEVAGGGSIAGPGSKADLTSRSAAPPSASSAPTNTEPSRLPATPQSGTGSASGTAETGASAGGSGSSGTAPGGDRSTGRPDGGTLGPGEFGSGATGGEGTADGPRLVDVSVAVGGNPVGIYIDEQGNLYGSDGSPLDSANSETIASWIEEDTGLSVADFAAQVFGSRPGPDQMFDAPAVPDHLRTSLDGFADLHARIRAAAVEGGTSNPVPETGGELGRASGSVVHDGDEVRGFDPIVDPGDERIAFGAGGVPSLGPVDSGDIDPVREDTGGLLSGASPFTPVTESPFADVAPALSDAASVFASDPETFVDGPASLDRLDLDEPL